MAYKMDNTELNLCLRVNGFDGFGETFETIDAGD
jgi:hypothetical protein